MTFLAVLCVLVVLVIAGIEAVRALVRRNESDPDHVAGGTIIGRPGHRCSPPSSHEWAGGELKVEDGRRYPEGTKWRCACGRAWWSTYGFRGLWLRWERDRAEDEILDTEPEDSGPR